MIGQPAVLQVQQVKKVNKFGCSMCQTKQAVAKVCATSSLRPMQVAGIRRYSSTVPIIEQVHAISSSAKDVRGVVMDLNAKRAMVDEATENAELVTQPSNRARASAAPPAVSSRWQDFVLQVVSAAQSEACHTWCCHMSGGSYLTFAFRGTSRCQTMSLTMPLRYRQACTSPVSLSSGRERGSSYKVSCFMSQHVSNTLRCVSLTCCPFFPDDHTGQITKPPTYPRPLKLACKGLTPDKANLHAIPPALSKPRNFPSSSRLPASAVPQLHNVTNSYTDVFQRAQAKSATTEQCRPPLHTLRQQQPFAAAIAKQCRPGLHTALTAATTKHCRPPLHTPMPTADKQNCAAAPVAGRWSQYVAVETQALADVSGSESYTLPALLAGCDADDCFVTCLD